MRAALLLLVAALLPLAGCASQGAAPTTTTTVPATTPHVTPTGAPAEGTNETTVFLFSKTFNATDAGPYTQDFQIQTAGWLCVHGYLTPKSGNAALTLIDPYNQRTTLVSSANGVLRNDTILANDGPGTWHLVVDLDHYSGEVGVTVGQMK